MRCPRCMAADTRVIDSRPAENGHAIRRRRLCESCDSRFTTYERPALVCMVRKRSGVIEPFSASKLRVGVESALADRPVPAATVEELLASVEAEVLALRSPVESDDIGRMVLDGLREVDEVAYLRFASVYREFQGAHDFEQALADLGEQVTAQE